MPVSSMKSSSAVVVEAPFFRGRSLRFLMAMGLNLSILRTFS